LCRACPADGAQSQREGPGLHRQPVREGHHWRPGRPHRRRRRAGPGARPLQPPVQPGEERLCGHVGCRVPGHALVRHPRVVRPRPTRGFAHGPPPADDAQGDTADDRRHQRHCRASPVGAGD
ncbi:hypothetical protein H4R21_006952, partial [Coemansia helicoidea]